MIRCSFIHFVYDSTLRSGDNFNQRFRKQSLAAGLMISIVLFLYVVSVLYRAVKDAWDAEYIIRTGLPSAAVCVMFFLFWMWNKVRREVSELTAQLFVLSLWVCFTLQILFAAHHPFHAIAVCLLSFSVGADIMPYASTILFFISYTINSYNLVAMAPDLKWQQIYILKGNEDTAAARLSVAFMDTAAFFITIGVLLAQKKESQRMIRSATEAHALARSVAGDLVRYDTAGARKRLTEVISLQQQQEIIDAVDNELVDVLCTIVRNFEGYRPYLPNYLLSSPAAPTQLNSMESEEDSSSNDDRPSMSNTSKTASPQFLRSDGPLFTVVSESLTSDENTGGGGGALNSQSAIEQFLMARSVEPATRKMVSLGMVHVPENIMSFTESIATFSVKMNDLMDTLHEIADITRAIVHSIYADTLQLSWNTARHVAQHEARAATFLARCRAQTGCVGAACTGEATFMLCGRKQ
eukprot:PhM_4_TR8412/c0_g2_i1/m.8114